jgi:heat shock protein beta
MLPRLFLLLGLLFATPAFAQEDEAEMEDDEEEAVPEVIDGFTKEDIEKMKASAETHDFQAEVSRLMDIIINSLYGSKDIFLRELLSNAGDALEKARFASIADPSYLGEQKEFRIRIEIDEKAKTLSITDTGCGMTKQELIDNLGTVAKSGTTNFLEAMKEGGEQDASRLIGQFGVGFYSAFLIADQVMFTTISSEEPTKQHIWTSSADGSFTVVDDPRGPTLIRGSRVTMIIKEEAAEYLRRKKVTEIVSKYSQFMMHPIYVQKTEMEMATEDDEDEELDDEDEEPKEKDEESKKWKLVNTQQPIWLRSKDDITEEEYHAFYKVVGKDVFEPLSYTHFNAEGDIEFRSILYIPKRAPHDMNMGNTESWKSDIKLYVRRVLVADQFEHLLPRYLMWVKGVVDSDDLPLNVNREQLQQNKILKVISKKLTRKVLEMLKKLSKSEGDEDDEEEEEEEKGLEASDEKTTYEKFYDEFKMFLLLGCHEDDANRSKLAKLLRFISTYTESQDVKKLTSLEDYVGRMQDEQPAIYYMSGEKVKEMEREASLEVFKKRGLEVLLLDEPHAEMCFSKIFDFEGVKLRSIQKAGDLRINWEKDETERYKNLVTMYKPLTKWWEKNTDKAGVSISKVEVSRRLTSSPAVVVSTEYGQSARQERMASVQDQDPNFFNTEQKVLEINADHPVIFDLLKKVKANADDPSIALTAGLVAQAAVLQSNFDLQDPEILVNSVYDLVSLQYGLDPKAEVVPITPEVPETPKDDLDDDEDDDEEETPDESGEKAEL